MVLDVNTIVSFLLSITAMIQAWELKTLVNYKMFKQSARGRLDDLEEEVF